MNFTKEQERRYNEIMEKSVGHGTPLTPEEENFIDSIEYPIQIQPNVKFEKLSNE